MVNWYKNYVLLIPRLDIKINKENFIYLKILFLKNIKLYDINVLKIQIKKFTYDKNFLLFNYDMLIELSKN